MIDLWVFASVFVLLVITYWMAGFFISSQPSPHVVSIPPKVEDAFHLFCYVPYMALSHNARLREAWGEDNFVINAQGGLTAKGLDHCNETSINTFDWIAASHAAEKRTAFHHGGVRANALAMHHVTTLKLARSHTWEIAMDYDIQQQELVSAQPTHDISMLDLIALTLIATRPHGGIPLSSIPLSKPGSSPLKRPSTHSDNQMGPSAKRVRSCCFRCRGSSHLPQDCVAESTSAGHTPTFIVTNAKSKHALLAPNGKQYCFNFAQKSSCTFGNNCINFHGCSLCNNATHGASACTTTWSPISGHTPWPRSGGSPVT